MSPLPKPFPNLGSAPFSLKSTSTYSTEQGIKGNINDFLLYFIGFFECFAWWVVLSRCKISSMGMYSYAEHIAYV